MASYLTRRLMAVAIVFAAFLICLPAFAQTGGVTGKCIGQDGKPLVGYTVDVERTEMKWGGHTKTSKKGDYTYIGLAPGNYKITLLGPDGKPLQSDEKHVGLGDPVECNFNVKAAVEEAQKAAEANPEYQKQVQAQKESASLKEVFDQGRELYAQQHYVEAAAIFEKALPLAKDRNIPVVLSQLADTWDRASIIETNPDTRKEDQAKSLDYFNKVIALVPTDASLHGSLGSLYSEMGRSQDAMAEFKKATDLDPAHAGKFYHNEGVVLYNKGQVDDAAVMLKKSTDLDPTNANAWYLLGMCLIGKATTKPDGTIIPAPGTLEAFQTYLKLAPSGNHAAEVQASLDMLQGKTSLEYKAPKKSH